jgi:hypothetical protein
MGAGKDLPAFSSAEESFLVAMGSYIGGSIRHPGQAITLAA